MEVSSVILRTWPDYPSLCRRGCQPKVNKGGLPYYFTVFVHTFPHVFSSWFAMHAHDALRGDHKFHHQESAMAPKSEKTHALGTCKLNTWDSREPPQISAISASIKEGTACTSCRDSLLKYCPLTQASHLMLQKHTDWHLYFPLLLRWSMGRLPISRPCHMMVADEALSPTVFQLIKHMTCEKLILLITIFCFFDSYLYTK